MTDVIKIINKKKYDNEFGNPNQEEIWDNIANPWKTYVVKTIPIVESFLEKASSDFIKKSKKKGNAKVINVIDLGCGNGRNMIPNPKIKYYGVDFSSGQLKHAEYRINQDKINGILFKEQAYDLSIFKNSMFDYGLFIATLHCIEGKKNREKSLKEFHRVLKKNAEGLISVWNSEDKRFDKVRGEKCGDVYMSWKEDGIPYMRYYYLYRKKEFLSLLKKTGFKILEFYGAREHDRFSKKNWVVRVKKI